MLADYSLLLVKWYSVTLEKKLYKTHINKYFLMMAEVIHVLVVEKSNYTELIDDP